MTEPRRRPTVDRLDEDLRAISDTVSDIKETVDEHTAILERHGAILDEHTIALDDIRGTQSEQGELLVEILRRLDAG